MALFPLIQSCSDLKAAVSKVVNEAKTSSHNLSGMNESETAISISTCKPIYSKSYQILSAIAIKNLNLCTEQEQALTG